MIDLASLSIHLEATASEHAKKATLQFHYELQPRIGFSARKI
jgi:hypothetical protein